MVVEEHGLAGQAERPALPASASSALEKSLLRLPLKARPLDLPPVWRYALALILVAATTLLRWSLVPALGVSSPYLLSWLSVVLAGVFLGTGPGLLTAVLGDAAIELLILRSLPSWPEGTRLVQLGTAITIGFIIVWLIHAVRTARVEALRAADLMRLKDQLEVLIEERTRALRESQTKFQDLIETTSDFIWEVDAQGAYTYCSPQMEKLWGLKPEETVGKTPFDLMPPGAREEGLELFRGFAGSKKPFSGIQVPSLDGRGNPITIEISGVPFFDASGELMGYRGITRDVTDRKQAQELLVLDLEAMTRLQKIGALHAHEGDLKPVLAEIVDAAIAISGADFGNIQLIDPASGDLRIAAQRGFEPWWLEFWDSVAKGRGSCGTALERGERVVVEDIERSPVFVGTPALVIQRRAGVRAVQSTPLISRSGTPVGMFSTHYRVPRRPDDRVLRLLDLLARQAADIIEHAQAEAALSLSLQKNSEILASIQNDFYVLDRDWIFVYANRNFTSRIGKEPEDLVGRNIWEMFPKHIGTVFEDNLRAAMDRREIRRFEIPGQYTEAWYRMTASPSADGITVIGVEITDIKRAEQLRQALAEQEKLRLGAAVEQASDSVVMIDLDGRIGYVNAAFESINGIGRKEANGTSYFDLLNGEPAAEAIREAVAAGRPWRGLLTRSTSGGRPVELEVAVSFAKAAGGRVVGGLITEKDVTQENALQRQLRQAQKMEALGTLAGGITHDFNNALGTIVLNAEMAMMDLEPGHPARAVLPNVLKAAERGKELVKQIITFSRQREWEKRPFMLAPVIEDSLAFLRATLPKNITLEEALAPGLGALFGDPTQINQIVVNLCQNAAQAMSEGEGLIQVELEPVQMDEKMTAVHPNLRPGPYVRMTVRDNGSGMTPEIIERIFEPFFTTRRPAGGTGLGLAVVHGIVKNYGGDIEVTSAPGRGTVFQVYLPRWEGEVAGTPEPKYAGHRGHGERILIVEDDAPQRNSLSSGLRRMGYKVVSKPSGSEALESLRTTLRAYDIVVTDQTMPGLSGLDLAAEIFRLRPDLPIILCTGFSERVDDMTVGQNGIRELIMKPFTLRELSQVIRRTLRERP